MYKSTINGNVLSVCYYVLANHIHSRMDSMTLATRIPNLRLMITDSV